MPSDNGLLLMSVWKGAFLANVRKPLANGDDMKFKGFVEVRSDDEGKGVLHFVVDPPRYVAKPPSRIRLHALESIVTLFVYEYCCILRTYWMFILGFYEMFFRNVSPGKFKVDLFSIKISRTSIIKFDHVI